MPVLVNSILQSLPALGTVAGLAIAFFLVFGIIGVSFFKGILHFRCVEPGVDQLRAAPRRVHMPWLNMHVYV